MSKRAQTLFMLVFGFFGLVLVSVLSSQHLLQSDIRGPLSFVCGILLGVASMLVAERERDAVRLGADRMVMWSVEENERVRRLYSRLGYSMSGRMTLAPNLSRAVEMVKHF